MIKIRVPATSANLGSGFDCLGVALDLYNNMYMEEYDGIDISSLDDTPIPTNEHNLVYQTVKRLYEECGKPFPGLRLQQENKIPMARGLGSSSACIAGALVGANYLLHEPLDSQLRCLTEKPYTGCRSRWMTRCPLSPSFRIFR